MAAGLVTKSAVTVTTAGTRVVLSATTLWCNSIIVQADTANTGYVYIGDSSVASTNGIALAAGESYSITISVNGRNDEIDLGLLYADTSVNSNKVRVAVIQRS